MIIIPARIGSSRFPNKVLADIGGLPMVVRTAKAVEDIDNVVIATDSQEVIDIARTHGVQAVLTSDTHQSGTDRIYEAAQKLELDEKMSEKTEINVENFIVTSKKSRRTAVLGLVLAFISSAFSIFTAKSRIVNSQNSSPL